MTTEVPELPVRYYAKLFDLLDAVGFDTETLLQKAGISRRLLAKPDACLRLSQVEAFVDAAVAMGIRHDIALDLGAMIKLSSHSMVGYAMLSSPTVDYALRTASRFFRLILPSFRMSCRHEDDRLVLEFTPVMPMSRLVMTFHLEAIASAVHHELREILRNAMPPYELYASYAMPPHAARYAELMPGARCHFGWTARPGLRLVYPLEIAHFSPELADTAALRMAENRCRTLVRNVVSDRRVSAWVLMMLREAADSLLTLEELAHTLNLSPRTLDRYLVQENTGFRALRAQVHQERAQALLDNPVLSITQIAHELGYTDASNFSRAYQRLTGQTPSAWRAARLAGAGDDPV